MFLKLLDFFSLIATTTSYATVRFLLYRTYFELKFEKTTLLKHFVTYRFPVWRSSKKQVSEVILIR